MSSRAHIVLIPGFAGFDALGQIQYYAGTTDVFREWLEQGHAKDTVLHYFDNLPSGAVKTRAKRLRTWLTKRALRNEFQSGDSIALVGHSTGGLDIRQLIADLGADDPLLAQIKRVVFISTPHHGSNIADAIRTLNHVVRPALRLGRVLLPIGRPLSRLLPGSVTDALQLNAALALLDAVREADPRNFDEAPDKANALEAYAQLKLWLQHMVSDFGVIDDLVTRQKRVDERPWPSAIATRSYASVSHTPSARDARGTTDVVYRAFHALATRGAFKGDAPEVEWLSTDHALGDIAIDDAVSDGVVNTRSMFWANGGATQLVAADHGDIIGHYRLSNVRLDKDGNRPAGRRHDGYDFFKSGTQFSEATFRQLWQEIFTFCALGEVSARKPERPASAAVKFAS